MGYDADPLVNAFDKNFSEINGDIFFSIPGTDFKIKVDDQEYYTTELKIKNASRLSKSTNLVCGISGMLLLLWLFFMKNYDLIVVISVWLSVFVFGVVSGSILIRSALRPLYRRFREEWATANDLPLPPALFGALDVIKAEIGKIIVIVVLGFYIGIREFTNWLN